MAFVFFDGDFGEGLDVHCGINGWMDGWMNEN